MKKTNCPEKKLYLPQTRYLGSKYKLLPWIEENLSPLDFHTVLDAFGGTGSVSYLLKSMEKSVTYNDYLAFNHYIGLALIENQEIRINQDDIDNLLLQTNVSNSHGVISRNFHDIFFLDHENSWLDGIIPAILNQKNIYKKALLLFALFQSCMIKRPFSLFHRKNLYLRTQEVNRSFGNKASWEKPFPEWFKKFAHEASQAVFNSNVPCDTANKDARDITSSYDLVYIDTPYISKNGTGVNYHDYYHFLEGITDYFNWEKNIDFKYKHRRLKQIDNPFNDKNKARKAYQELLHHFRKSIIVVSYRSDGIPSIEEIQGWLKDLGKTVRLSFYGKYQYALSTNRKSQEVLIIAL